jgi:tetratricopeptide (TPR) repeat protein
MAQCDVAFRAGNMVRAKELSAKAWALAPNRDHITHALGIILSLDGHKKFGLRLLNRAVQLMPLSVNYRNDLNLALVSLGDFHGALIQLYHLADLNPDNPEIRLRIGVAHFEMRQVNQAAIALTQALCLDPIYGQALANAGAVLGATGRNRSAAHLFGYIVRLIPDNWDIRHKFATLSALSGHGEVALEQFAVLERVVGPRADILIDKGIAYEQLGQLDDAYQSYAAACALDPNAAYGHQNRANLDLAAGRLDAALPSLAKALALDPGLKEAFYNLGVTLSRKDNPEQAIVAFHRSWIIDPMVPKTLDALGNALLVLGRAPEAIGFFQTALTMQPAYGECYNNIGSAWGALNDTVRSLANSRRSIRIDPTFSQPVLNESMILILQGHYAEGWAKFEARWGTEHYANSVRIYPQKCWLDQGPLRGKRLLIYTEAGLGDMLNFVRYVPQAEAMGAKVILEVQSGLVGLMRASFPEATVIALGETLPDFDLHCPVMSLPYAFRAELGTIPAAIPYLRLQPGDQGRIATMRAHLQSSGKINVGVVWAGNRAHKNDRLRSIGLETMRALFDMPGIQFHCLQKEISAADRVNAQNIPNLVLHDQELSDFIDTAVLASALDLVISIDTSVIHLTGGLGVETWTLLAFAPDFRWMLDRDDTPWYPTMRLFRQADRGEWSYVIDQVKTALHQRFDLGQDVDL